MDFRKALTAALTLCGKRAGDPVLLYNALCDTIGNNLLLKPQAEIFHRFNRTCHIVEEMMRSPEPRMILTLLESCKQQPDVPEKLCLKWIHTVFEIYYRASREDLALTEQILTAVENDFFEPPQEGLALPSPQKKQPRRRSPKVAAASRASIPAPPAGVPAGKPARGKVKAPAKAFGSPIPSIPDKAWVYLAENSPVIHVSESCPQIRPTLHRTLYRATYERARYVDFVRVNNLTTHTWSQFATSRHHCPPVCPKCGDFTPTLSTRNSKREYKQL